jgi:PIN domain nuclease of toxin-antitoxin system
MRLLLDTHIALAVLHRDIVRYGSAIERAINAIEHEKVVSAASLWEVAIKNRLGKLAIQVPLESMASFFQSIGYDLLHIDHRHAVETLRAVPATNDPFDRMLLAQCQLEGLSFVTVDRVLVAHPLAWRP